VRRISASEAAKLAAASAEKAWREAARRQEEALQRRERARKQNAALALAACAVLAVILVTGIVYVATLPSVTRIPSALRGKAPDRFVETRTGVIRFEEGGRNQCRQLDFNNETGRFANEAQVPCYDPTAPDTSSQLPRSQAADRLDAIRGTFVKK
jgi:hypothetical protein